MTEQLDNTLLTTVLWAESYPEAQAAVDRLSDAKLDIEGIRIIGHDMKSVEVVTGRLTTGKAAGLGALSGGWFGLFIGLLLGLFTLAGWLGVVLTGVVLGAIFGAIAGAVGHAMTGGRRDFSSAQGLQASRYEIVAPADRAVEARRLLGV